MKSEQLLWAVQKHIHTSKFHRPFSRNLEVMFNIFGMQTKFCCLGDKSK